MKKLLMLMLTATCATPLLASEADLVIPESIHEFGFLHWGFLVTLLGFIFGIYYFAKTKALPVHQRMEDIGEVIYKTCSTYL